MAYRVDADHNNTLTITVTPALRVAWTCARAWHGDKVKIAVRTEMVKNGAKLKLEISPKNSAVIDTIAGEVIQDNKNDKEYTINWKTKTLPADISEYIVKATLEDFAISAESNPLLVDLKPPAFSC